MAEMTIEEAISEIIGTNYGEAQCHQETMVLAAEALREKAEREKGCEYCNDEEQRNDSGRVFYKELPHDARFLTTLDDAHLQIAFDEKSGRVLHFEDDSGDRMFDVKILNCPMCGRALKGGE